MADNTANKSSTVRAPRKPRTRNAKPEQMFTATQVASIVAQAASAAALGMVGIANSVQTIAPGNIGGDNVTSINTPRKRTTSSTSTGKPGRKPQPGSGLSKARALFAEMKDNQQATTDSFRKTVVTAFKEKLKLKPDIANTYYHVIAGKKSGGTPRGRRKKVVDATPAAAVA